MLVSLCRQMPRQDELGIQDNDSQGTQVPVAERGICILTEFEFTIFMYPPTNLPPMSPNTLLRQPNREVSFCREG